MAPGILLDSVSPAAINEHGDVAYIGSIRNGTVMGGGLLTVEDGLLLGFGDTVDGRVIDGFRSVDLNSNRDLVSHLRFADGTWALVVGRPNAVTSVPLPSSMALLAFGLVGLAVLRRRNRV